MGWSKTQILAATGGRALREGKATRFGEVVTDSTKVKHGSVFLALKGERHDGHRFVADALRRGVSCVIVQRDLPGLNLGGGSVVEVRGGLRALGDLAHYRRQDLSR